MPSMPERFENLGAAPLSQPPKSRNHFDEIWRALDSQAPFSFIRFSDGEMEIIRNEYLEIGKDAVKWRKGIFKNPYPVFDWKLFDPERHQELREDLLKAAGYHSSNFYKGIPARHNKAIDDQRIMISLNGGRLDGLTFADLFLNANYRRFISAIVPLFIRYENVFVIGNYRMNPSLLANWDLIPLGDGFFQTYPQTRKDVLRQAELCPPRSLVLSSASSLSNVVGMELHRRRPDITFVDIGTSLHAFMGLPSNTRRYHYQLAPWSFQTAPRKILSALQTDFRLKW